MSAVPLTAELFFIYILLFLIGCCWGSFLNVVAVRLVAGRGLYDRSACPSCSTALYWWELIPLLSWLLLRGRCSHCQRPILWWYPALELLTGLWVLLLAWYLPTAQLASGFILSSALIITIRTDGEHFLIARFCSIGLVPWAIILSVYGLGIVTPLEGASGAIIGFFVLSLMNRIFYVLRGYEGLGEGDVELMAGIGSFLGPYGVWMTLLLGSLFGTLYSAVLGLCGSYYCLGKHKLPFGLFLALGAGIVLIARPWLALVLGLQ
jgi:leader peptidase (prepilin peptidase)/N-methyltransferase